MCVCERGSLFSQPTSNRTRENSLRLHQEKFRLDVRKDFFREKVVKQENRLPRGAAEPPSLEAVKQHAAWGQG